MGIIHHILQHHGLIVDLGLALSGSQYTSQGCEEFLPAAMNRSLAGGEEHTSSDATKQGQLECSVGSEDLCLDKDIDGNEEEEANELEDSASSRQHKPPAPCRDTTDVHEVKRVSTFEDDSDSAKLGRNFTSCINDTFIQDAKDAFEMYETRAFQDCSYRVNKKLPILTKLNSGDIVCAILLRSYWYCKVPQCGATFDQTPAMDLHLRAL